MNKYPPAVEGLPLVHQGKTRDTFATSDPGLLLVVATDRLSTHNVVHRSLVRGKGEVLTALTLCWSAVLKDANIPTHLVTAGRNIYNYLPKGTYPGDLHRRAIIVRKLRMIPVEFIFRAYLAGSLYEKYYKYGRENPYGVALPPGMQLMEAFPEPIFTPTEKSETDPPMLAATVIAEHQTAVDILRRAYFLIRRRLQARLLDAVDTKFEVGFDAENNIVIGDEIVTPDSSRFVLVRDIRLGKMPPWLDKQFFRDEAEKKWGGATPYPLTFDHGSLQHGVRIYHDLFRYACGITLEAFQTKHMS